MHTESDRKAEAAQSGKSKGSQSSGKMQHKLFPAPLGTLRPFPSSFPSLLPPPYFLSKTPLESYYLPPTHSPASPPER